MLATGSAVLEFNRELNTLSKGKELRDGLSAVVQSGRTLWLANDETIGLECLCLRPGTAKGEYRFGEHKQFALHDYLRLPVPPPSDPGDIEEVDVEGLDVEDDYLWLVGSHSLKRAKPDKDDSVKKNVKRLAEVRSDGNRFLLARIPVVKKEDGTYTLKKEVKREGLKRTAAQLAGDATGNDLTRALAKDKHLKPFFAAAVPGKDNGFDVEGLAVRGERVFLGLRGPVLRGYAIIIELRVKAGSSRTLELKKVGPKGQLYRKHFLHLGGLGIRDLCAHGSDLLVLAGPTMELDGPVRLFRWVGGARLEEETVLLKGALQPVADIPSGDGVDHAEGMALFSPDGRDPRSILVVYDSPAEERQDPNTGAVRMDVFPLPGLIRSA